MRVLVVLGTSTGGVGATSTGWWRVWPDRVTRCWWPVPRGGGAVRLGGRRPPRAARDLRTDPARSRTSGRWRRSASCSGRPTSCTHMACARAPWPACRTGLRRARRGHAAQRRPRSPDRQAVCRAGAPRGPPGHEGAGRLPRPRREHGVPGRPQRRARRDPRATAPPAPWTRARLRDELGSPTATCWPSWSPDSPQKGLHLLLDALDGCATFGSSRRRREGPQRAELQGRIEAERLPARLLGHRQDVPALSPAADLVVSSAVWEGQPINLQEALHAGAAIVATDVGGSGDVLGEAAVHTGGRRRPARRGIRPRHRPGRAGAAAQPGPRRAQLPTEADAVEAALRVYREVRTARDRGAVTDTVTAARRAWRRRRRR